MNFFPKLYIFHYICLKTQRKLGQKNVARVGLMLQFWFFVKILLNLPKNKNKC